ncbi:hypothetical protein LEMLEM_LOCUS23983, partial [Lemmus lemmus]
PAPGNTNLLQEEDGHQRGSLWSLSAIWARNCSCLDCLTGHKKPTERGLLNLPKAHRALCLVEGSTLEHMGPDSCRLRPEAENGNVEVTAAMITPAGLHSGHTGATSALPICPEEVTVGHS